MAANLQSLINQKRNRFWGGLTATERHHEYIIFRPELVSGIQYDIDIHVT